MSAKALSSYILTNKYANHVKDARRRETWVEATSRVFGMHSKQYASVAAAGPYISEAEEAFGEMLALGSQRVLQYAGTPVERKNSRGYNCVTQSHFLAAGYHAGTGLFVTTNMVDLPIANL